MARDDAASAGPLELAAWLWSRLGDRLKAPTEVAAWFVQWLPVAKRLIRLAALARRGVVALRRQWQTSGEGQVRLDEPLLSPALLEDVRQELRGLREEFPQGADLLFGAARIDGVVEAALEDEAVRGRLAGALARVEIRVEAAVAWVLDRMLAAPVPPAEAAAEAEALLGRLEALVARVVEEWILPGLLSGSDRAGES